MNFFITILIVIIEIICAKLLTTGGKLGESVILPCGLNIKDFLSEYDGKTPVLVNWFRHQGSSRTSQRPIYAKYLAHYIDYEPHVEREYENRLAIVDKVNLNISNLIESDEGLYECRLVLLDKAYAENKNGSLVYLQIYSQPEFENLSDEIYYYKLGTPLRLYCYATGKPTPSITWLKNGLKLNTNSSQLLDNELITDRFPIEFTCKAENLIGSVEYSMKVVRSGDILITEELKNQTIVEGMLLNWPCRAQSNIALTYKWFKDSIVVQTNLKNWTERGVLFQDGMLYINEVSRHDSGLYECNAYTNEKRITTSAYLNVIYPPNKIELPSLMYSMEGTRRLVISCPTHSNPPVHTYEWFKDDLLLSNDKRIKILSNGTLTITSINLNDQGTYRCTAQNSLEKSYSNGLELKVIETKRIDSIHYAYDAQQSYKLPCETQSTASTKWFKMNSVLPYGRSTVDSNGHLILFNLNSNDSANYLCLSGTSSKQIVGLIIFENTTSSLDRQEQQYELKSKNTEDFLPLAPLNLKLKQISNNKILVEWEYPEKTYVKIDYYKIEYRCMAKGDEWSSLNEKILVNDKHSFEMDATYFETNAYYEIRMHSYSTFNTKSKSSEVASIHYQQIQHEEQQEKNINTQDIDLVTHQHTSYKSLLKISQLDIILVVIFIILIFILLISIIACVIYYKSSKKFKKHVQKEMDNEWELPLGTGAAATVGASTAFLQHNIHHKEVILGHGSLRYKQKTTVNRSCNNSSTTTSTKSTSPDDEWLNTSNELVSNSNISLRDDQKELLRHNKHTYRTIKVDYV